MPAAAREARAGARRQRAAARGERFGAVMAAITRRLPLRLARVVSPQLAGFALISSVTFGADLVLLTTFHSGLRLPLPVSITLAYAAASGMAYALNRSLNFRSHAAIGPQAARYAAVVVVNYLAVILGVTDGLAALGADYRLARLAAAVCEAAYMYAAMRWLIFRDAGRPPGHPGPAAAPPPAGRAAPRCEVPAGEPEGY